MLSEIRPVRQIDGEPARRWFSDDCFDLIVWYRPAGAIDGFQLCYDKKGLERAVIWLEGAGLSHHRVDDGEGRPGKRKASPVLTPAGPIDHKALAERFTAHSGLLEEGLARFVLDRLAEPRRA